MVVNFDINEVMKRLKLLRCFDLFVSLKKVNLNNMELTISIKDPKDIASFLNLIRKYDYVEIVDVKENNPDLPIEHRILLDERLKRIEDGKTSFKNWDLIKNKYDGKAL